MGTGNRKLHLGHFAFMRAVVQGLDHRDMWERYLALEGDHSDARTVRSTTAWIRAEFAAAARRERRHGAARLVVIDVTQLFDDTSAMPSLEEFAAECGLDDFSEAEQAAAYEARYGKPSARQSRRARLLGKQLEALAWLEALIAQPPLAGDAVAAWLPPRLAIPIEASGLLTLADLVGRINGVGSRWAAPIRGIGAIKAARVTEWLSAHQATIGLVIGEHVARPRSRLSQAELAAVVPAATAIRPLEKFIVPTALDGSHGRFRRPQEQCLLEAATDYEAILAWLRAKHGPTPAQRAARKARRQRTDHQDDGNPLAWLAHLSHTQRAYRKEAERFLLWAIIEHGKPLSSMTQEDCVAYRNFLADPQPRSRWCGTRARERWSPLWRPFEGPLSAAAQRQAVVVLRNLYSFLVGQAYLFGNPWTGVTVPHAVGPRINAGRSFTVAQWAFIEKQLERLPEGYTSQRLRLALHLLYATGLRLSEVVAATLDDLRWVEYPFEPGDDERVEGWLLRVVGKGDKVREVPVPIDVVGELSHYLVARGFDPNPEDAGSRDVFVLGHAFPTAARGPRRAMPVDSREGIAASTLYDQIKAFFRQCAETLRGQGDTRGAERLAQASTHWLRHTHASHAIAAGTQIEVMRDNLGHASLATTTVYVTSEQRRRVQAMARFWDTRVK
ncbi:MAG: int, tyrosine-based site-specific recombinase [Thermomicrobiales bacterium]|nr:MAG: int, tyrosine-based site-specific recombinase [Thermomicrobiales bacterium]